MNIHVLNNDISNEKYGVPRELVESPKPRNGLLAVVKRTVPWKREAGPSWSTMGKNFQGRSHRGQKMAENAAGAFPKRVETSENLAENKSCGISLPLPILRPSTFEILEELHMFFPLLTVSSQLVMLEKRSLTI